MWHPAHDAAHQCVGLDVIKPTVVHAYLFHRRAAPVYNQGYNTPTVCLSCAFISWSNILIIASLEALKTPQWELTSPTHQSKPSVCSYYASHLWHSHTPIDTWWEADMERGHHTYTHWFSDFQSIPVNTDDWVVATTWGSSYSQQWVETDSNDSHTVTNHKDNKHRLTLHTLSWVWSAIIRQPHCLVPSAVVSGGHMLLLPSPLGQLDIQ